MSVYQSEMKVPIRPAPPPPVNSNIPQKFSKPIVAWNGSSKVSHNKVSNSVQKKKPPPRPPPPKFPNSKQDKKNLPTRPSQLITSLFHKRNNSSKIGDPIPKLNQELTDQKGNNVLSLIDFSSPPSSPTFTTRSSSDALSVNSFGSDGVTPCSTSSGNTSNVESGFEDDFDFFLGSTKKLETQLKDPWSVSCQEQRQKNHSPLFQSQKLCNKNSAWVAFSSSNIVKNSNDVSAMPTIIRVKPERQKPIVTEKVINNVSTSNVNVLAEIFQNSNETLISMGNSLFGKGENGDDDDDEDDEDGWSSESPPMPTCPPPAPPAEVLQSLLETTSDILLALPSSAFPPTIKQIMGNEYVGVMKDKPHGVALYDFGGEHPNDLSFKENDVINLVRRIDDNWFVGEMNGREGTVPANFISVRVPLEDELITCDPHVTALYSFYPETWEDLEFGEGSVIKVLGRINEDWLYGEFNGRTGQFPANFVDRVPPGLPTKKK